jgi:hypothetical protein
VKAFSSLDIILNTKGGLEKYKGSCVAKSNHAMTAGNTKHEMRSDVTQGGNTEARGGMESN